jgi:hypothetical protein
MSQRLEPRVIDPTRCWVRHVRRTAGGEAVGAIVAGAAFTAQPLDALGGRQGWISAEASETLSGDGGLTVRFPNAAGEDGVLHRRRFACLTDPAYRSSEEWLELYREPYDAVSVVAIARGRKSRQAVELECVDVATVLNGYRGSELDLWDGHAPRDVFEHYSRLPSLLWGDDFAGFAPAAGAWGPWTTDATVSVSPAGGVPRITAVGAWSGLSRPLTGLLTGDWTVEARVRLQAISAANGWVLLRLGAGGAVTNDLYLQVDASGAASLDVPGLAAETGGTLKLPPLPTTIALRLIARNERLYALVNGELAAELRRPAPFPAYANLYVQAWTATADVDDVHVEHLQPFALRGAAKGDRNLPGAPPPVGLRARFYNAAGLYLNRAAQADRVARVFRSPDEPIAERLDAMLNYPAASAFTAPNLPGAFAARWVGAIYLDLAAGDRRVRLPGTTGNARLYIGRTMRDDPAASSWTTGAGATLETANLRAFLGTSTAGWFPIVVELTNATNALAIILQDSAVDAAGAPTGAGYAAVPSSRLSPVGVVEDELRHESCRTVLDSLAETFGLQWRVEPRALETGEFPGQIIPLVRVGRDTELVIDDLDGVDVQADVDAADAIDSLIADAAGIADPKGSGQLSAQVIDYVNARAHMGLSTGYESLSEVTERQMLETRIGNLLALRSSPNEQVGVRPSGQRDLADSFPLTGALALMKWRAGDGVRLALDDVDVIDRTPRQMTGVTRVHLPAGVAAPTVTFRQRPRSGAAILRRTLRAVYSLGRNYQGTLTALGGGYTQNTLAAAGAGAYSYVPLPQDLDRLVGVYVDVARITAGQVTLEVNGANGPLANAVGRYDVTSLVKVASSVDRRAYARAVSASVALTIEYQIVAVLRI